MAHFVNSLFIDRSPVVFFVSIKELSEVFPDKVLDLRFLYPLSKGSLDIFVVQIVHIVVFGGSFSSLASEVLPDT